MTASHLHGDEIALVGMAGRFPGASTIEEYWKNLSGGVESIRAFTPEELTRAGVVSSMLSDPAYVNAGAPLEDGDGFDAAFFGFTPREAELMDPQQRLFLELSWAALEDAGYDAERYQGLIGVFGGVGRNTYLLKNAEIYRDLLTSGAVYEATIGSDKDFAATRVAYKLNLRGPSLSVQTACSTSAVAIHLACQALINGDCDMALAGGARVRVPLTAGYLYMDGGIPSPDGHCRAFDENAAGTVYGSGGAVIVVKRLEDAQRDRDTVYSIIRGSAINNDGAAKVGYTAPSVQGQSEVITSALRMAEVDPSTIGYVEAHGTGTTLGDPIEVAALTEAYRRFTPKTTYCAIGSVKTNLGHLDAGAGVAGVVKASLMLRHAKLVPSLNYDRPNPQIDFETSPFYVNTEFRDWDATEHPRRAAVSSFGMGGTNAHIILEEVPSAEPHPERDREPRLLVLSARTATALSAASEHLADHLEAHPEICLDDAVYTLQTGRGQFEHRLTVVADSGDEAIAALRSTGSRGAARGSRSHTNPPYAFMFAGGGAQYLDMGRGLYRSQPAYRSAVDECTALLKEFDVDVGHVLFPTEEADPGLQAEFERPSLALPALFSTEYATAQLWMSLGVTPSALLGHSMGEYTAACLAGVMSLRDALAVVSLRGRLFEQLPPGGMLSVPLSERDVRQYLVEGLSLAAVNHPSMCVVSGEVAAIDTMEAALDKDDIEGRRLHISVAAHSELVEPILEEFGEFLASVDLRAPGIPFLSNVTGTWITAAEATDPSYWVRHLRGTVRFSDGLAELLSDANRMIIETGPGQTLSTFARQHPTRTADHTVVASIRHPREPGPDLAFFLRNVGQLWIAGADIRWDKLRDHQPRRVSLPSYPFERKRFWLDPTAKGGEMPAADPGVPTAHATHAHSAVEAGAALAGEAGASNSAEPVPSRCRRDFISAEIKHILHDLSGMDTANLDEGSTFLEIGFDSLFLTRANGTFHRRFGVKVTFRQLFEEADSIGALATFIDSKLAPEALADEMHAAEPSTPNPPSIEAAEADLVAPPQADLLEAASETLAAEASTPTNAPAGALERIITKQLEMMAAQLRVLGGGAETTIAETVEPPTQSVPEPESSSPVLRESPSGGDSSTSAVRGFGPFAPVKKRAGGELTDEQKTYLDGLMARYTAQTPGSKELAQRYRQPLADPRTVGGFRREWKEIVYPISTVRANGSRVWDVDGNEYVDVSMGFGVNLFGHSPDFLTDAIEEQVRVGLELVGRNPKAGELAELICDITGAERLTYCQSASEAILGALRVARTVTGRDRIAMFAGAYHGRVDSVMVRAVTIDGVRRSFPQVAGIPQHMVDDVLVLDYGDPSSLDLLRENADELAVVLVEPVQSRNPHIQPKEFLHELRALTEELDIALVFDETITGFRVHPGGAQAHFGVQADLTVYGKPVGGMMPMAILAGKSDFMDAFDGGFWAFGDSSIPEAGVTYLGGTHIRHPIALAASLATMKRIKDDGPGLQAELNRRTDRFVSQLNHLFDVTGAPIHVAHFSSLFLVTFPRAQDYGGLLFHQLRLRGVHIYEDYPCFLSTAHTDDDLDFVIAAFDESVRELQDAGLLERAIGGTDNGRDALELAGSAPQVADADVAPTEAQREILDVANRGTEASLSYNLVYQIDLDGAMDPAAMTEAVNRLIGRHDALRLTVAADGSAIRFSPEVTIAVPVTDLSGYPTADATEHIARALSEQTHGPFDLENGPLIRAELLRLGPERHVMLLAIHHIACDGFSIRTVLADLSALYSAIREGREASLPEPTQFSDYARHLAGEAASNADAQTREYWLDLFANPPQESTLAEVSHTVAEPNYACHEERASVPAALVTELRRVGAETNSTLFSVLLSGLTGLLHRVTGNHEIVVGAPTAGQLIFGDETLVGHCVHMHPIRSVSEASEPFNDHLVRVQRRVRGNSDHPGFTVGTLTRQLRSSAESPLIQVQFNLEPQKTPVTFSGLQSTVTLRRDFHPVDIVFNLVESERGIDITCWYNTSTSYASQVAGWLAGYVDVLRHVASDSSRSLEDLFATTQAEVASDGYSLALTEGQQEIWLATQVAPEANCAYNLANTLRLNGSLEVETLTEALQALVARHDALRTTIDRDGLTQQVAPALQLDVPIVDLSQMEEGERDERLTEIHAEEVETPFDLAVGPLIRARVIRLATEDHLLILTVHHVICDGWSSGILFADLAELYTAARRRRPANLVPPMQLGEYVQWQAEHGESGARAEDEAFWVATIDKPFPVSDFPSDRPRPAAKTFRADREVLRIDQDVVSRLQDVAAAEGVTLYTALLGAFECYLHRLTAEDEIALGVSIAGQTQFQERDLVGHFVSMLPMRRPVEAADSFSNHVRSTQGAFLDAFDHQNFSYGSLVKRLTARRDPSRTPLVSVIFNMDPPSRVLDFDGVEALPGSLGRHFENFDVFVGLVPTDDGLVVECTYNVDLFDAATIHRRLEGFAALIEAISTGDDRPIAELPVVSASDRELVAGWNATGVVYPGPFVLHGGFERWAAVRPGDVAVVVGGVVLTYGELNSRANRLARLLVGLGVGPGVLVGVFMERSVEMVVALYAVLKAGGAYVPLDPEYPVERLGFMVDDAELAVVLVQERLGGGLPECDARVVAMDAEWDLVAGLSGEDLLVEVGADDVAYVIFTSGSTGRPKGVVNTHGGIYNRLMWMQDCFGLDGSDRVLQKTPFSFDVSVWEFFWPLMVGARLVVAEPGGHRDAGYLVRTIVDHEVTTVHFVPSMLRLFLDHGEVESCGSLRRVICSGEALTADLQGQFFTRLDTELHNLYGPTEAAVDVTHWVCRPDEESAVVPIGRPIANTQIHLLDEHLEPVPVGVTGELHIGGVQVAKGYLNRPELTAERFIFDHFRGTAGARLYKSGDLARYMPDGNIEFLGRADFQVKIRGNRIELGEIEAALDSHPAISRSIVTTVDGEDPSEQRLIAYVTSHDDELDELGVRDHAKARLPQYMIPSRLVILDELPVNTSGKIDRGALPQPGQPLPSTGSSCIAPRTPLEKDIATVWCEVLRLDDVGIHDDFFDLGGHSLDAMRVNARIGDMLDLELSLGAFFDASTIEGQALAVTASMAAQVLGADDVQAIVAEIAASDSSPDPFPE